MVNDNWREVIMEKNIQEDENNPKYWERFTAILNFQIFINSEIAER